MKTLAYIKFDHKFIGRGNYSVETK